MTGLTPEQHLLRTAFGLLGDGAGEEWDENREYTRGIVELIGDFLGVPGDYVERRAEILARIRAAEPRIVYVVDETGGTWWFNDKADAEAALVAEAWTGAAHLVIGRLEVPRGLTDEQIADYCISNAPDSHCDHD